MIIRMDLVILHTSGTILQIAPASHDNINKFEGRESIQYSRYFISATSYLARDSNPNPTSTSKVIVARTFWGQQTRRNQGSTCRRLYRCQGNDDLVPRNQPWNPDALSSGIFANRRKLAIWR